jgi:hypothetical protein|mmetsp:Transcript_43173/g.70261  ORF Transcript_43173/g.70261 Transcript_43173/m.70261 type:complete len:99 (+) Transcript_43173:897-1193(+)
MVHCRYFSPSASTQLPTVFVLLSTTGIYEQFGWDAGVSVFGVWVWKSDFFEATNDQSSNVFQCYFGNNIARLCHASLIAIQPCSKSKCGRVISGSSGS